MRTRSITALVAVVSLGLAACGGGDQGGGTLSEADFVDELSDVCGDAQRDLERIDVPADLDDTTRFADDALEVYNETLVRLQGLGAPDDLAKDYGDFVGNIEDQIKRFEDLSEADGDQADIDQAFERLLSLSDEQSEIARDLDVADCDPNEGDDSPTTEDADATATTAPAGTTAPTPPPTPAPTAPPITLPSTVVPVTTPETPAPAPTTNFTVVDLTTIFVAPDGFYLDATTPTDATLEVISSLPELNETLLEVGVATLVSSDDNTPIADIWVGVSRTDAMPADWKNLDCPNGGDLRTSENGLPGIICYGASDSPTWEIFTATVGDVGISIYTLVPDVSGDLVADAFLLSNP